MTQHKLPQFLSQPRSALSRDFAVICAAESARIADGISSPSTSPWSISIAANNQGLNRYYNVLPWDSTRVHLDSASNDYINASIVQLPNNRRYIASQGPTRATIGHFWAMAFQQAQKQQSDTVVIVMVTPLVERHVRKCDEYWPGPQRPILDLGDEANGLTVRYSGREQYCEGAIIHTIFELVLGNISKQVHHFHYTQWADARVPPSLKPLLILSLVVRKAQAGTGAIPIVHCSAGVGRTGTFIVLDYLMHDPPEFARLADDLQVDLINDTVSRLREARMLMVQTEHQYVWLYEAAAAVYRMGSELNT